MSTSADTTINALRSRREQTVREHIDAESRGDIKAALATFYDANYDVVPFGATTNGAAAVEEMLRQLLAAFPDFRATPGPLHHGDEIVFVESRLTGTHRGEWAGLPATGRSIDVRSGCVFHFDDDRLIKETVYFDHATLLAQLNAEL